jgi:hypothetical protein
LLVLVEMLRTDSGQLEDSLAYMLKAMFPHGTRALVIVDGQVPYNWNTWKNVDLVEDV